MDAESLKKLLFKPVVLNTRSGQIFNGSIEAVGTDSITLRDRYGATVLIAFSNIAQIAEKTNGGRANG